MERDLIEEIHELTKNSVFVQENIEIEMGESSNRTRDSIAVHSAVQAAAETDFQAELLAAANIERHVKVKSERNHTPALPEHFQSESIPVLEADHKVRIGANRRNGSFSPILREKPTK